MAAAEPEGPTELEIWTANVASYKLQVAMKRIPVSDAIDDLMEFAKDNMHTDHAINPNYPPKKDNPWEEKKGCALL